MHQDLEIPRELYASEVSFTISRVFDNGFDVWLGWPGNIIDYGHEDSYVDACRWLQKAALKHYPASAFAKKYGHGLRLV